MDDFSVGAVFGHESKATNFTISDLDLHLKKKKKTEKMHNYISYVHGVTNLLATPQIQAYFDRGG